MFTNNVNILQTMKTQTISLRVPIDFKTELIGICKTKGITMSDYCLTKLTPNGEIAPVNAQVLQKLSSGGSIGDMSSEVDIPSETLKNLAALGGGAFVGISVYKALKNSLQANNNDWTDEKIEAIAMITGVASALLSGYGIHSLLKSLDK